MASDTSSTDIIKLKGYATRVRLFLENKQRSESRFGYQWRSQDNTVPQYVIEKTLEKAKKLAPDNIPDSIFTKTQELLAQSSDGGTPTSIDNTVNLATLLWSLEDNTPTATATHEVGISESSPDSEKATPLLPSTDTKTIERAGAKLAFFANALKTVGQDKFEAILEENRTKTKAAKEQYKKCLQQKAQTPARIRLESHMKDSHGVLSHPTTAINEHENEMTFARALHASYLFEKKYNLSPEHLQAIRALPFVATSDIENPDEVKKREDQKTVVKAILKAKKDQYAPGSEEKIELDDLEEDLFKLLPTNKSPNPPADNEYHNSRRQGLLTNPRTTQLMAEACPELKDARIEDDKFADTYKNIGTQLKRLNDEVEDKDNNGEFVKKEVEAYKKLATNAKTELDTAASQLIVPIIKSEMTKKFEKTDNNELYLYPSTSFEFTETPKDGTPASPQLKIPEPVSADAETIIQYNKLNAAIKNFHSLCSTAEENSTALKEAIIDIQPVIQNTIDTINKNKTQNKVKAQTATIQTDTLEHWLALFKKHATSLELKEELEKNKNNEQIAKLLSQVNLLNKDLTTAGVMGEIPVWVTATFDPQSGHVKIIEEPWTINTGADKKTTTIVREITQSQAEKAVQRAIEKLNSPNWGNLKLRNLPPKAQIKYDPKTGVVTFLEPKPLFSFLTPPVVQGLSHDEIQEGQRKAFKEAMQEVLQEDADEKLLTNEEVKATGEEIEEPEATTNKEEVIEATGNRI